MAYDVFLQVTFHCDNYEFVSTRAGEYLLKYFFFDVYNREALWFLESLNNKQGLNVGPKGGVISWALVSNHTDVEKFIESLREFFEILLGKTCNKKLSIPGGPEYCSHIIVIYEPEQSECAHAYEIYWDENHIKEKLIIDRHDLPFKFNQL